MRWPDSAMPVRMRRVALVAPEDVLRDVLVRVAAAAAVELDRGDSEQDAPGEAARRLRHAGQLPPAPGPVRDPSRPRPARAGRPL